MNLYVNTFLLYCTIRNIMDCGGVFNSLFQNLTNINRGWPDIMDWADSFFY